MIMTTSKFIAIAAFALISATMPAQTQKRQVINDGGTGRFKAEIVSDASLNAFTIYRPQNIKDVAAREGRLPIVLYANGACANDNVQMRLLLNEVVSHGYVAIAIGPYDEDNVYDNWREVLYGMRGTKKVLKMGNGEVVTPLSEEQMKARREAAQKNRKKNSGNDSGFRTYGRQLLEALDWLTDQNINPESEYYQCLDLSKVAAMGQSCGGAQVLSIAHDPRLGTCVIMSSGIGDIQMSGASKESLKYVHTPMLYINGGPTDIAYQNALKDYDRIGDVPVAFISTDPDGHHGTYYEKDGGAYAVGIVKWLDWQLKGDISQAGIFLDEQYGKRAFPTWEFKHKNF